MKEKSSSQNKDQPYQSKNDMEKRSEPFKNHIQMNHDLEQKSY